jgi:predicted metalloprotease with PDZ domain
LWLEEGLATYLEPLTRVRARQLDAAEMWRDLARDLPQGAPRRAEGGLRGTHTWHRLYWQGAVFWLTAELAIFQRTHGERSLHDALCAWAKLEDSEDFDAERAFTAMDAALGQPILFDLYRKASARGIDQDPTQLLAKLGVVRTPTGIELQDDAPAAKLRQQMTEVSARACAR